MTTRFGEHADAQSVNPTMEDAFWRINYSRRPYFVAERGYGVYQPAYRYGWEARDDYRGLAWKDIEGVLRTGWFSRRGKSTLEWADAKLAIRDAWERIGGWRV